MTMTPAAKARALDDHLNEMVLALHAAVKGALPHVKDDPRLVDQALRDCQEILEVVLDGNVAEWLGGTSED